MSDIQVFGKTCPVCRKFAAFGKIEIAPNAPPSILQSKLAEKGWLEGEVDCETQGCNTKIFGERDQMMLKATS